MKNLLSLIFIFVVSITFVNGQDYVVCGDQSSLFATLRQGESTDPIQNFGKTLIYPNETLNATFYDDPSNLLGDLVDNGHALEYVRTKTDAFDEKKAFSTYEQTVQGVRVIGGGVNVVHERQVGTPDGPSGPCDGHIFFYRAGIVDDLSPSNPNEYSLSKSTAATILNVSESDIESVEKSYRKPLNDGCTYRLVADIQYTDTTKNEPLRAAVIDLQSNLVVWNQPSSMLKTLLLKTMGLLI